MSATRILLQNARLDIFQTGNVTSIDLKGWIANQGYFIDADIQQGEFTLRASNPDDLNRALANDFNRMACASFESAAGISPDQALPKSLAWGVIRAYYASFFAAHALMRLYGISCSQLEPVHTQKIFQSAKIFGKTGGLSRLDAGIYSIEIDQAFSSLKFRKLKDSHKDAWATLLSLLETLSSLIPQATALSRHKIEAALLLDELKSGVTRSNCTSGNWLSAIRNSVNYQHSHGVWFPYSSRALRADLLDSASRHWHNTPKPIGASSSPADLDSFFGVSVLLVALLRELTDTASGLSNPVNPALRNGCMRLINEVRPGQR